VEPDSDINTEATRLCKKMDQDAPLSLWSIRCRSESLLFVYRNMATEMIPFDMLYGVRLLKDYSYSKKKKHHFGVSAVFNNPTPDTEDKYVFECVQFCESVFIKLLI
jgi:hypothetical protein